MMIKISRLIVSPAATAVLGIFLCTNAFAENRNAPGADSAAVSKSTVTASGTSADKGESKKKSKTDEEKAEELKIKIAKIQAELPEMTTKETVVRVKPDVKIYLPNGALDLSLKQEFKGYTMTFYSEYDLIDNKMGFGLDFLYNFKKIPVGLALEDNVNFDALFANSQYMQRVQSISPYAKYLLSKQTQLRGALRFENTSTSSLGNLLILDKGRNILGEIGIFNDNTDKSKSVPTGGARSLNIQRSFPGLGSDYSYSQAQLNLQQYVRVFDGHYLEENFQAGYPLIQDSRPLSTVYYAGGYKIMRGYDYQEFAGNAMIYNIAKYNIPLAGVKYAKIMGMEFSIATWNFYLEGAKIGDKEIYSGIQDAKYSIGSGVGYTVLVFNIFPINFEVSLARAFEPRQPKWYFIISTLYYTWGNR